MGNYHHHNADVYALLFGLGNAYYVGHYDSQRFEFTPLGVSPGSASGQHVGLSRGWPMDYDTQPFELSPLGVPPGSASVQRSRAPKGWPMPNVSDTPSYYSFNPHATDTRGPNNSTRRLMFGWIEGPVSSAVTEKSVPYWQSAHSLMRTVTVSGRSIVQLPAAGTFEPLRTGTKFVAGPISVNPRLAHESHMPVKYLKGLRGDALEIIATFSTSDVNASSFGVSLRVGANFSCNTGYNIAEKSIAPLGWKADIVAQPVGKAVLHVFLDRSIIETYTGGAVATTRCLLPAGIDGSTVKGVDLWAIGGTAKLVSLEAWEMETMWKPVSATVAATVVV